MFGPGSWFGVIELRPLLDRPLILERPRKIKPQKQISEVWRILDEIAHQETPDAAADTARYEADGGRAG